MQICDKHWQDIRTALDNLGLTPLIASSGEELEGRLNAMIAGGSVDIKTYDPLMVANMAISKQALEQGGLYMLGAKEDGTDYCPLCELAAHTDPDAPAEWIKGCTEAIKANCDEAGITPKLH